MVSPHRRSDSGGQVEPRASFLRDGCTRCHSGGHVTGCVPCGHAENPATQVSVSHVLYPQGRHIQCCFSHKPLLWAHTDTPLPFSVDIHVHLSVSVSVSVSSPEAVWLSHTLKCAGSSPSFSFVCVCVCVCVCVSMCKHGRVNCTLQQYYCSSNYSSVLKNYETINIQLIIQEAFFFT